MISESIAACIAVAVLGIMSGGSQHRSAQQLRGIALSQCSALCQGDHSIAALNSSGESQHSGAQQLRRIAASVPNSTLHLLMQLTERNTTAYHTMLQHTTLCYSIPHYATAYHMRLQHTTLCYSIQHDATAYHMMLQHTTRCYSIPHDATRQHTA